MYVFGGEKKYNSHLKQHECLSDIKFLNLGKYFFVIKIIYIIYFKKIYNGNI